MVVVVVAAKFSMEISSGNSFEISCTPLISLGTIRYWLMK